MSNDFDKYFDKFLKDALNHRELTPQEKEDKKNGRTENPRVILATGEDGKYTILKHLNAKKTMSWWIDIFCELDDWIEGSDNAEVFECTLEMWGDTDYWGEHDCGIYIENVKNLWKYEEN